MIKVTLIFSNTFKIYFSHYEIKALVANLNLRPFVDSPTTILLVWVLWGALSPSFQTENFLITNCITGQKIVSPSMIYFVGFCFDHTILQKSDRSQFSQLRTMTANRKIERPQINQFFCDKRKNCSPSLEKHFLIQRLGREALH